MSAHAAGLMNGSLFLYYVELGLRSLRRNIVLTALLIAAIGVGVGASMTTLTVFRAMSGDPIPGKSRQLFTPQIDSRGPLVAPAPTADHLQTSMTYTDAMALMKARFGSRQSAMYGTVLSVHPADPKQKPFRALAHAVYADFFAMFDVPFKYGAPWTAAEDGDRAAAVVLTKVMNDRIFGGRNSVGKTFRLGGDSYTVAGVLDEWRFIPVVYDLERSSFAGRDEMFLPFTRAIDKHMSVAGSVSCDEDLLAGFEPLLRSDCTWLGFWVELHGPADVRRYRAYLNNYAADQRRSGRFHWPPHTQLRDVREWLDYRHVVPGEIDILMLVSFGFLLVCLLNAMGLMLAKVMGRAGDIGVRRALGASRGAIFSQCLIETGVVGLAGGLLGLTLTAIGLSAARALLPKEFTALTHLDVMDVLIALSLALGSTVMAGLYPTWRAAQVQLTWQLKAQ
jgi:putative ABC transport system permease protein